jgi:hypothetical protein
MAAVQPSVALHERPAAARVTLRNPAAPAIGVILVLCMAVALVMLYALWEFWPTSAILKSGNASTVNFFGWHRTVAVDIRLFVIVALGGGIGGLLHSTRSFAWYVGHQGLKWRWVPYYAITLVLGAGLATIFYVVIRGGVFSGRASTTDVNPYGFVAIGALVGLFTEQALEMLRRVAEQFFAQAPQGADNAQQVKAAAEGVVAPIAVTATASSIGPTTATLAGTLTPSGSATTYHFEYGETTDYGSETEETPSTAAGPTWETATVNNLSPGTTYHFRIVASNEIGVTAGDDAVFTTAAE